MASENTSSQSEASNKEANQSAVMSAVVDIVIGLEDESGEQKPVEIDEADEQLQQNAEPEDKSPQPKRKVSITDRVLKNRNCEQQMQHIEETAKNRKKELAELLTEHAQIVQEVSVLVRSSSQTSLNGKENNNGSSDITSCSSEKNDQEG